MNHLVAQIIEQRCAQLISRSEAIDSLSQLADNARFNAAYSDSLGSFKRWSAVQAQAISARMSVRCYCESTFLSRSTA